MAYTSEDRFEWDPAKAAANRREHGVSFEEARDLLARPAVPHQGYDECHSQVEDRFWAVGPVHRKFLRVVYTEDREGGVRILGARRATPRERRAWRDWVEGRGS